MNYIKIVAALAKPMRKILHEKCFAQAMNHAMFALEIAESGALLCIAPWQSVRRFDRRASAR
jgi:hypothetical protein